MAADGDDVNGDAAVGAGTSLSSFSSTVDSQSSAPAAAAVKEDVDVASVEAATPSAEASQVAGSAIVGSASNSAALAAESGVAGDEKLAETQTPVAVGDAGAAAQTNVTATGSAEDGAAEPAQSSKKAGQGQAQGTATSSAARVFGRSIFGRRLFGAGGSAASADLAGTASAAKTAESSATATPVGAPVAEAALAASSLGGGSVGLARAASLGASSSQAAEAASAEAGDAQGPARPQEQSGGSSSTTAAPQADDVNGQLSEHTAYAYAAVQRLQALMSAPGAEKESAEVQHERMQQLWQWYHYVEALRQQAQQREAAAQQAAQFVAQRGEHSRSQHEYPHGGAQAAMAAATGGEDQPTSFSEGFASGATAKGLVEAASGASAAATNGAATGIWKDGPAESGHASGEHQEQMQFLQYISRLQQLMELEEKGQLPAEERQLLHQELLGLQQQATTADAQLLAAHGYHQPGLMDVAAYEQAYEQWMLQWQQSYGSLEEWSALYYYYYYHRNSASTGPRYGDRRVSTRKLAKERARQQEEARKREEELRKQLEAAEERRRRAEEERRQWEAQQKARREAWEAAQREAWERQEMCLQDDRQKEIQSAAWERWAMSNEDMMAWQLRRRKALLEERWRQWELQAMAGEDAVAWQLRRQKQLVEHRWQQWELQSMAREDKDEEVLRFRDEVEEQAGRKEDAAADAAAQEPECDLPMKLQQKGATPKCAPCKPPPGGAMPAFLAVEAEQPAAQRHGVLVGSCLPTPVQLPSSTMVEPPWRARPPPLAASCDVGSGPAGPELATDAEADAIAEEEASRREQSCIDAELEAAQCLAKAWEEERLALEASSRSAVDEDIAAASEKKAEAAAPAPAPSSKRVGLPKPKPPAEPPPAHLLAAARRAEAASMREDHAEDAQTTEEERGATLQPPKLLAQTAKELSQLWHTAEKIMEPWQEDKHRYAREGLVAAEQAEHLAAQDVSGGPPGVYLAAALGQEQGGAEDDALLDQLLHNIEALDPDEASEVDAEPADTSTGARAVGRRQNSTEQMEEKVLRLRQVPKARPRRPRPGVCVQQNLRSEWLRQFSLVGLQKNERVKDGSKDDPLKEIDEVMFWRRRRRFAATAWQLPKSRMEEREAWPELREVREDREPELPSRLRPRKYSDAPWNLKRQSEAQEEAAAAVARVMLTPIAAYEEAEFIVRIDRSDGQPLGVDVEISDDSSRPCLLIEEVPAKEKGLIQQWNAENPTSALEKGDRIVSVNGMWGDCDKLLEECGKFQRLELLVVRTDKSASSSKRVRADSGALEQAAEEPEEDDAAHLPRTRRDEDGRGAARRGGSFFYTSAKVPALRSSHGHAQQAAAALPAAKMPATGEVQDSEPENKKTKEQLEAAATAEAKAAQLALLATQVAQAMKAAEEQKRKDEEEKLREAARSIEERLQSLEDAKKPRMSWRDRLAAVGQSRAGGSSTLQAKSSIKPLAPGAAAEGDAPLRRGADRSAALKVLPKDGNRKEAADNEQAPQENLGAEGEANVEVGFEKWPERPVPRTAVRAAAQWDSLRLPRGLWDEPETEEAARAAQSTAALLEAAALLLGGGGLGGLGSSSKQKEEAAASATTATKDAKEGEAVTEKKEEEGTPADKSTEAASAKAEAPEEAAAAAAKEADSNQAAEDDTKAQASEDAASAAAKDAETRPAADAVAPAKNVPTAPAPAAPAVAGSLAGLGGSRRPRPKKGVRLRIFDGEEECPGLVMERECVIFGGTLNHAHVADGTHSSVKTQHAAILYEEPDIFLMKPLNGHVLITGASAHAGVITALRREKRAAPKEVPPPLRLQVGASSELLTRRHCCFQLGGSRLVYFFDILPSSEKVRALGTARHLLNAFRSGRAFASGLQRQLREPGKKGEDDEPPPPPKRGGGTLERSTDDVREVRNEEKDAGPERGKRAGGTVNALDVFKAQPRVERRQSPGRRSPGTGRHSPDARRLGSPGRRRSLSRARSASPPWRHGSGLGMGGRWPTPAPLLGAPLAFRASRPPLEAPAAAAGGSFWERPERPAPGRRSRSPSVWRHDLVQSISPARLSPGRTRQREASLTPVPLRGGLTVRYRKRDGRSSSDDASAVEAKRRRQRKRTQKKAQKSDTAHGGDEGVDPALELGDTDVRAKSKKKKKKKNKSKEEQVEVKRKKKKKKKRKAKDEAESVATSDLFQRDDGEEESAAAEGQEEEEVILEEGEEEEQVQEDLEDAEDDIEAPPALADDAGVRGDSQQRRKAAGSAEVAASRRRSRSRSSASLRREQAWKEQCQIRAELDMQQKLQQLEELKREEAATSQLETVIGGVADPAPKALPSEKDRAEAPTTKSMGDGTSGVPAATVAAGDEKAAAGENQEAVAHAAASQQAPAAEEVEAPGAAAARNAPEANRAPLSFGFKRLSVKPPDIATLDIKSEGYLEIKTEPATSASIPAPKPKSAAAAKLDQRRAQQAGVLEEGSLPVGDTNGKGETSVDFQSLPAAEELVGISSLGMADVEADEEPALGKDPLESSKVRTALQEAAAAAAVAKDPPGNDKMQRLHGAKHNEEDDPQEALLRSEDVHKEKKSKKKDKKEKKDKDKKASRKERGGCDEERQANDHLDRAGKASRDASADKKNGKAVESAKPRRKEQDDRRSKSLKNSRRHYEKEKTTRDESLAKESRNVGSVKEAGSTEKKLVEKASDLEKKKSRAKKRDKSAESEEKSRRRKQKKGEKEAASSERRARDASSRKRESKKAKKERGGSDGNERSSEKAQKKNKRKDKSPERSKMRPLSSSSASSGPIKRTVVQGKLHDGVDSGHSHQEKDQDKVGKQEGEGMKSKEKKRDKVKDKKRDTAAKDLEPRRHVEKINKGEEKAREELEGEDVAVHGEAREQVPAEVEEVPQDTQEELMDEEIESVAEDEEEEEEVGEEELEEEEADDEEDEEEEEESISEASEIEEEDAADEEAGQEEPQQVLAVADAVQPARRQVLNSLNVAPPASQRKQLLRQQMDALSRSLQQIRSGIGNAARTAQGQRRRELSPRLAPVVGVAPVVQPTPAPRATRTVVWDRWQPQSGARDSREVDMRPAWLRRQQGANQLAAASLRAPSVPAEKTASASKEVVLLDD
eukprot:TRINITY_DN10099_c1_g1_i4.p1 TRINITY_DN10099_c1_g1~~TRINITY_DN10099_c1_g1_i4.p1  ORF type:complete len:3106 (+),score=1074.37 TRINITY_DN10099_c1_g1_i4:126-9443(+)